MRTLRRILLSLVVLIAAIFAIAYIDGLTLPVNHVATVTGTVAAPPDKVFALITNVSAAPTWRHAVKSVTVLPPDAGRDHWTEHLAHNQDMTFLATRTEAPTRRDVLLDLATPVLRRHLDLPARARPHAQHHHPHHHRNRLHQPPALSLHDASRHRPDLQPQPISVRRPRRRPYPLNQGKTLTPFQHSLVSITDEADPHHRRLLLHVLLHAALLRRCLSALSEPPQTSPQAQTPTHSSPAAWVSCI